MPPKQSWDESSDETSSEEETAPPQRVVPVAATARKHFDDEEDSDAPDNWDDEDSEEEREKAKKAAETKAKADAIAAANKKPKAVRIEEHREAARRRRAMEDEESSDEETEAEKRARLKAQEKEADLSHAEALIGDVDARNNKKASNKASVIADPSNPGQAIDLSKLPLFQPKTKGGFDQLSEAITPLIRAQTSKAHFPLWMPNFAKGICQDMNSVDIKKVASALTALSNEKLKAEKAADGTGKKTKAVKSKTTLAADRGIGAGRADTKAYDEELSDGDFM
ncbi:Eukaryotic translation initiation factor 3 subunit J [Cyphellophora attinorum]|uniref:Eukaryotic translation initiation factor 3 subunit J n=1 Tax=Cyphellophora attinorum TaxID=1664694 RepID=A0A0N0NLY6_9EURO|nr:Eukaryotic translation initiation factor 3 subunit J [Phialophora attinorum]KPI39841.1 Eukaryotic translation initiation factor 3 subunit J [Phialophora attinorum]